MNGIINMKIQSLILMSITSHLSKCMKVMNTHTTDNSATSVMKDISGQEYLVTVHWIKSSIRVPETKIPDLTYNDLALEWGMPPEETQ